MKESPGSVTRFSSMRQMSSKATAKSTGAGLMELGPSVMVDASKMSLMRRTSMSQALRTMRMYSVRSSGAVVMRSTSVKPMMAFSGVRSSWVMEAMKPLFSWPEALARSVTSVSSRRKRVERVRL